MVGAWAGTRICSLQAFTNLDNLQPLAGISPCRMRMSLRVTTRLPRLYSPFQRHKILALEVCLKERSAICSVPHYLAA